MFNDEKKRISLRARKYLVLTGIGTLAIPMLSSCGMASVSNHAGSGVADAMMIIAASVVFPSGAASGNVIAALTACMGMG